ncbi:hypothetical protein [Streptomyces sp. NPDC002276]
MPNTPKAMNLRFRDPRQRAAIEAAAKQAGVSLQEYILAGFKESMARSGEAFAAEPGTADSAAEQRAAEADALRELERREQGHAA